MIVDIIANNGAMSVPLQMSNCVIQSKGAQTPTHTLALVYHKNGQAGWKNGCRLPRS